MKKIFALLLLNTIGLSTIAQQLENTTWTVTDTVDAFYIYFSFNEDTLSYSYDGILYTDIATYMETGNMFTMIDLASGPCPGDTGEYTFLVQNDSLFFTLVNDLCPTRPMIFQDYNWFIPQLGISQMIDIRVNVFPNPTEDQLKIQIPESLVNTIADLLDISGKKVLSTRLENLVSTVDIGHLLPGTYFLRLENEKTPIKVLVK